MSDNVKFMAIRRDEAGNLIEVTDAVEIVHKAIGKWSEADGVTPPWIGMVRIACSDDIGYREDSGITTTRMKDVTCVPCRRALEAKESDNGLAG